MSKHTPEPWEVAHYNKEQGELDGLVIWSPVHSLQDNGKYLLICHVTEEDTRTELDRANAERIVECVNAMAGIEDPKKHRETWDAIQHLHLDSYHKLKEEHDQLKAAVIFHMNDMVNHGLIDPTNENSSPLLKINLFKFK